MAGAVAKVTVSHVIRADVLEALPSLSGFDACLCDPPYGLKFMGKAWDHGVPSVEVWRLVLDALKPGAMLMAFGGTRTYHRQVCAIEDAGFEIRDGLCWLYGSGFPKSYNLGRADIAHLADPSDPGPDRWQGYGTALKPAWEPITLAMKPLDGTFVNNALAHGVAGLNVDGGRIGTEVETWPSSRRYNPDGPKPKAALGTDGSTQRTGPMPSGRWPANLLLDEEAAGMLDAQSGESSGAQRVGRRTGKDGGRLGVFAGQDSVVMGHSDSGGASRFFYTAKADPSERRIGGIDCNHPTLKPIALTAYLAKLLLPPKRDTSRRLLVPFAGAGSEMIGALRAGWDEVVGIELSEEYAEMAMARIAGDAPLLNEVACG